MLLEIFEEIKEVLQTTNIQWVARQAKVGESTLYNWLEGKTKSPRLDTIYKVADCLGFDVKLIKRKAKLATVKRAA